MAHYYYTLEFDEGPETESVDDLTYARGIVGQYLLHVPPTGIRGVPIYTSLKTKNVAGIVKKKILRGGGASVPVLVWCSSSGAEYMMDKYGILSGKLRQR